jgi:DNA-binding transcriptional ArsR family regulator
MRKLKNRILLVTSILGLLTILNIMLLASSVEVKGEGNSIKVNINLNGSATWVIESFIPLKSEDDVRAFEDYVRSFEKYRLELLGNFTERIERIVRAASEATGRRMEARRFDVSAELIQLISGERVGVVRYRFLWDGFSEKRDGEIIVGDVFIGGFYLYEGDSLSITIPKGSTVVEAAPKPDKKDGETIIWFGKKTFPDKTPYLKISTLIATATTTETYRVETVKTQTTYRPPPSLPETMMPIIIVVIATIVGVLMLLIGLKKRTGKKDFTVGDADAVINAIRELGGSAFQQQIVGKTGFSKSKVSEILKALEKNKIVRRVRVGRRYLVVLRREAGL